MKQVVKASEPQDFKDWKASGNADWVPSYSDLKQPEKPKVQQALIQEQFGVCCYCGRRVTLSDSHIEHFRPQERRPDLALEWSNLHASCIKSQAKTTPRHCGHAKDNLFDESRVISPLELGCETRFRYRLDGSILSSDGDVGAEYMIGLLKLDIPFLNKRREQALQGLFFDGDEPAQLSIEDIRRLLESYSRPAPDGSHYSFSQVVTRFCEQELARAV